MEVPREIQTLVKAFYPQSRKEHSTHEDWISATLNGFFDDGQRNVIRRFLDELLSDRYSDEEIQEVWRSQYPSYDFTAGGHRVFFAEIRKVLG